MKIAYLLLVIVGCLSLSFTKATSQIAPPCDGCYEGFRFDSTFAIGGYDAAITTPQYLKDSLHFTFVRTYGGPYSLRVFDRLNDSYYRTRWFDSLTKIRLHNVVAAGLKMIYSFPEIPQIGIALQAGQAYYKGTTVLVDVYKFSYINEALFPANVKLLGGYAKGASVVADTTDSSRLVASLPIYTKYGTQAYNMASFATGDRTDSGKYLDFILNMHVTENNKYTNFPDDSVIAYVVLMVRDLHNQTQLNSGECLCNFYYPFDTLRVTKRMYIDVPAAFKYRNGFKDVIRTFTFPVGDTAHGDPAYQPYFAAYAGPGYSTDTTDTSGGSQAVSCRHYCAQKLKALKDSNRIPQSTFDAAGMNNSDFSYSIYTTRKIDWEFGGATQTSHVYSQLKNRRFDSLFNEHLDSLMADTLNSVLARFENVDEAAREKTLGTSVLTAWMQRLILAKMPNDKRGIWANPMMGGTGFRAMVGDLDSTDIKVVHMYAQQDYLLGGGGPIPVKYANPDSMDTRAMYLFYRAKDDFDSIVYSRDTILRRVPDSASLTAIIIVDTLTGVPHRNRQILYNTEADYLSYLSLFTDSMFNTQILLLRNGRDAARTFFQDVRREQYPFYNVVQVQGYLADEDTSKGYMGWSAFMVPTPEHISAQCWLSLNYGVDGIVFGDMNFDGSGEFGPIHWVTGDFSQNYYDSMTVHDPFSYLHEGENSANPYKRKWIMPRMWYGFQSRMKAMKTFLDELHDKILPVYNKLDHRSRVISYNDTSQSLTDTIPILKTFGLYQADWYNLDTASHYIKRFDYGLIINPDSVYLPLVDNRPEAFAEISYFVPGPAYEYPDDRFLLVTNKRIWSVDRTHYSARTLSYSPTSSADGFGARDVRKPFVILRNVTDILTDSLLVEKVGREEEWSRRSRVGDTVELDWLEPGVGAMYRIRPIPMEISQRGVAWNNAVHAENIGCSIPNAPSVVIYERDSIVYIRKFQSGSWYPEIMLSDAVDTTRLDSAHGYARRGYNYFPTIASVRNPNVNDHEHPIQSMFAVWEHQESDSLHRIQANRIDNIFADWSDVPEFLVRYNLTNLATMPSGMNQTPSVTGIIDGYLVSWAKPKYGISLLAVRDLYVNLPGMPDFRDTMGIHGLYSIWSRDSIVHDSVTRYPTLASVPQWRPLLINDTVATQNKAENWSNGPIEGGWWTTAMVPATMSPYWVGYLSYQQGNSSESSGQQIVHHVVGVQFLPLEPSSAKIRMAVLKPEHISIQLPECNFLHPSITADSVRVGVAFETVGASYKTITLRFRDVRDSLGMWVPLPLGKKPFATPAYRWGDFHIIRHGPRLSWVTPNTYTRPSVTEFPTLDSLGLATIARGALTWQWTDAPVPSANGVMLYRYGTAKPERIENGQDVSMVFAPYITGNLTTIYDATGVLRRGSDSTRFVRTRAFGDPINRWYYPLTIDSVYPRRNTLLSSGENGRIFSYFTASRYVSPLYDQCLRVDAHVDIGIFIGIPPRDPDPDHPPDTNVFRDSPKFFGNPINGNTWTTNVPEVSDVSRTSAFVSGDTSITLDVRVVGSDSMVTWLNTQPFDSTLMHPADIGAVMELIKTSDSSVLWRSDTLWARTADDSVMVEPIVIPVDSVTSSGTWVFARLRPILTENLDIELSSGFFFPDSSVESVAPKRVIQQRTSSGAVEEKLSVSVVPNPATGSSADIVVSVWEQGTITVSVYDTKGEKVMDVDRFQPETAGEYVAPIDLRGFRNGVYVVVVQQGVHRVSTTMPIVR